MSKTIFETKKMMVTAFVGNKGNASVQITMKGDFCYEQLTKKQIVNLCYTLLARVLGKKGYRATD